MYNISEVKIIMVRAALILLLLVPAFAYCQISVTKTDNLIEIGKVGELGSMWIKCSKSGDGYIFTYRDTKFTKITEYKSFSFLDIDNAFDKFYEAIISVIENQEELRIDIPNGSIFLQPITFMGSTNVSIGHFNNAGILGTSQYLTRKQVNKLFGK